MRQRVRRAIATYGYQDLLSYLHANPGLALKEVASELGHNLVAIDLRTAAWAEVEDNETAEFLRTDLLVRRLAARSAWTDFSMAAALAAFTQDTRLDPNPLAAKEMADAIWESRHEFVGWSPTDPKNPQLQRVLEPAEQ